MPHQSLRLLPGVDQNKTPALNEAAISTSQLIRYMPDRNGNALPQKMGGWEKFNDTQMTSDIKALWAWSDSNADKHLGVGMTGGLATITDGMVSPRTPGLYEISVSPDFSTTDGSAEVDITDAGSNVGDADSVFIMTPVSVGGLILFGLYSAIAQSADEYSINSTNIIGLPLPATATVASGGTLPVFDTTTGSSSVLVTLPDHGYSAGTSNFAVLVPVTLSGAVVNVGNYTVQTVPSANTFTILIDEVSTTTDTATMNNGMVLFRYYVGRAEQGVSDGYGTGGYGRGGYGTGVTTGSGRTFTTTAASGVGDQATLSFNESFKIPVGSRISVTGVTPTGFNGNWTVTSSVAGSPSTVTYTAGGVVSGPQTVAGTITVTQFAFAEVEDWTLDNWGGDLIACPQNGAIYGWSAIDGGTQAALLPNAPTNNEGALVAMPQRQVVAWGSTFNDIQDPLLVRWCDINNYSRWIANATNQAGSFRLTAGSKIVAGLQASGQIMLWTDLALWSMQYVGFPGVYSFNEVSRGCGLIGRKAMGATAAGVFWMSQSQFFRLSGDGVAQVPCSVWDVVFQNIDMDYVDNIRCAVNARFSEIMWYYPSTGSGGVPDAYVKFNYAINEWDYGTLTRTAWIDQSVYGPPIGAGNDRYIYQHETTNDADGQAMVSSFRTGYFALADGDMLTFVDQWWPDMKWSLFNDPTATGSVQITFYVAEYPGQTPTAYGPYTVTRDSTYFTPRFRARLVSIEFSSSDIGSFWRMGLNRYRGQADGKFL